MSWLLGCLVLVALLPAAQRHLLAAVVPEQFAVVAAFVPEVILVASGIVILATAARGGRLAAAVRHPSALAAAAFIVLAAISALVNGVQPHVAAVGLAFTFDAIAIFFLARLLPIATRDAMLATGAVVAVAGVAAVLAVAQALLDPGLAGLVHVAGRFGEGARIGSMLGDPNSLGTFLAMSLPFPILAAAGARDRRWQLIAGGVTVVLFAGVWLSYSRGAWAALVVGLLLWGIFAGRRALLTAAVAGALALALTSVMPRDLLVAAAPPSPAPSPAATDARPTATATPSPAPTPSPGPRGPIDSTIDRLGAIGREADLRTMLVRNGLPILADHPLLGVGPGRYGGAAASLFPSPVHVEYGTADLLVWEIGWNRYHVQQTVDNFWLHLAVESGTLGLAAFLALVGVVLWELWRARQRPDGPARWVIVGAAGALLVVSLGSVTTMALESNLFAYPLWLVLGVASSLAAGHAREERR